MENQHLINYSDPIVYIVDDDEAVLDSLGMLLNSLSIKNSAYSNGQDFLNSIKPEMMQELSGCIVMDVRMPGMSGMECHQALKSMKCTLPIIFITGHGDIPMAVEAMKEGAVEFIQKPFRDQELIDCIQKAIRTNIQSQNTVQQAQKIERRIDTLSKRELDVLRRVISGQSNKLIAAELHLSQRTIEIHRAKVMEKMNATSLADLITMVLTQN